MSMRLIIVGLGVQGRKRLVVAADDVVATVDPVAQEADYKDISEVSLESFDAALVCVPDAEKHQILAPLLAAGKHVLVEKPLLSAAPGDLERLECIAAATGAVCYTAYNHRFEPHFAGMKRLLDSGRLGKIYRCRLFYGNGTAEDVRSSPWRDAGTGVLADLGSHLLDTALFWFGRRDAGFRIVSCDRFENAAFDHAVIASDGSPALELEMTLLSWRNSFTCDVFAEHGSAHIRSLCKWGPADFTVRWRRHPSGRPDEEVSTLARPDPTWTLEYAHFKDLCNGGGKGNLDNDLWIDRQLAALGAQALRGGEAAA